jgi:hypothetical protein
MHIQDITQLTKAMQTLQLDSNQEFNKIESTLLISLGEIDKTIVEHDAKQVSIKKEQRDNEAMIAKLKRAIPPPREPIFEELKELTFILPLPVEGRLNAKKKPKKKLRTFMLEDVIKDIASGAMDGVIWEFKQDLWPDDEQMEVINIAIDQRNALIVVGREREEQYRREVRALYVTEVKNWEAVEAERIVGLGRCRNQSRLLYLSMDAVTGRETVLTAEAKLLSEQIANLKGWAEVNSSAIGKYHAVRARQSLERQRLLHSVTKLKRILIKIVASRRDALEMPAGHTNEINLEYLTENAETLLKTLRYDMV